MAINIYKTGYELISAIVLYFIEIARQAIEHHGEFNVALAGGSSPIKMYEQLSSGEYKSQVEWDKVNFFFGDERYVPADDPQSNSFMAQKALFDPLKISEAQIFKVDTTLSPDEAAKKYDETIFYHFCRDPIRFDFLLLGLGEDAHTASLFPFSPVLDEISSSVKAVFVEALNSYRITMTAQLINQSKHIAFLIYGKEKAEAVYHVLKGVHDAKKYPAQLIKPLEGELQWFIQEDAASLLET